MRNMKIVILDANTINPGDLSWEAFKQYGNLSVYPRTEKELIVSRIGDAEIVMTSKCLLTAEILAQCTNLRWIGILATGINMVDLSYASSHGITVTNIPSYSTDSVAQFTFSLLLEVVNRVGQHNSVVHHGAWATSKDFCFTLTPQIELAKKTFGVVGFGNIGRKVAKIAEAFGMNVLISSRYPNASFETSQIHFASIDDLYKESDIISLHCPLTEESKHMICQNSIAKMKSGVIIINTSRGPLIDEEALAKGLTSGYIYGAGLDVLSVEPPENNPLIGLSNCIITPHIAWITKEARERLIQIAIDNLDSYLLGNPINCVNVPMESK